MCVTDVCVPSTIVRSFAEVHQRNRDIERKQQHTYLSTDTHNQTHAQRAYLVAREIEVSHAVAEGAHNLWDDKGQAGIAEDCVVARFAHLTQCTHGCTM